MQQSIPAAPGPRDWKEGGKCPVVARGVGGGGGGSAQLELTDA